MPTGVILCHVVHHRDGMHRSESVIRASLFLNHLRNEWAVTRPALKAAAAKSRFAHHLIWQIFDALTDVDFNLMLLFLAQDQQSTYLYWMSMWEGNLTLLLSPVLMLICNNRNCWVLACACPTGPNGAINLRREKKVWRLVSRRTCVIWRWRVIAFSPTII